MIRISATASRAARRRPPWAAGRHRARRGFALSVALVVVGLLAGVLSSAAAAAVSPIGRFADAGPGPGGSGSGPGQLAAPRQAAVLNSTGDIYVADSDNNRIQVFTPTSSAATYLTEFGNADLVRPTGLAIDQDTGDVYVSDTGNTRIVKYVSDGAATPTFTIDPGFTSPPAGGRLAFDQGADQLVVADPADNLVKRFTTAGAAIGGTFDGSSSGDPFAGLIDIAVDASGDVIVVDTRGDVVSDTTGTSSRVVRFDSTGAFEATIGPVNGAGSVTVDPDDGRVIVGGRFWSYNSVDATPPHLYIFAADGTPVEDFNVNALYAILPGLAAAGGSTSFYVFTVSPFNDIWAPTSGILYAEPAPPAATIAPATAVGQQQATVNGTVQTSGRDTTYRFEYRERGAGTWAQTAPTDLPGGGAPVAVDAVLGGLQPNTDYEVRLLAENPDGLVSSGIAEFRTAAGPPTVETLGAGNVTDTSAWLRATVNPHGYATTYHFEYGTTPAYGATVPADQNTSAGSGSRTIELSNPVRGLLPGTTYHFRIVAESAQGRSEGADRTFTTKPVADRTCANAGVRAQQDAEHLPDCRGWEQVSPVNKSGYAVGKNSRADLQLGIAANGGLVSYESTFPFTGQGSGGWSGVQSGRVNGGWDTIGLLQFHGINAIGAGNPSATDTLLRGTTPDQRTSVYWDCTSEPYGALWIRRADGSTQRIADATNLPLNPACIGRGAQQPWFLGISDDGRHVVFNSTSRLGPAEGVPGSGRILYEWVDDGGAGTLRVVNRTDDPTVTLLDSGDASLGGAEPLVGSTSWEGLRNAISDGSDGHSRILFQNPAPSSPGSGGGSLYARVDGTQTIELSAPADGHTPVSPPTSNGVRYVDAAADGSVVYFVADGDLTPGAPPAGGLYRYDVTGGTLTWIGDASLGGATTGIADADGSRLYFQSTPTEVRLWDQTAGASRLVVRGEIGAEYGTMSSGRADFQFTPGVRTTQCASADVTVDGRYLAFVARRHAGDAYEQVYRYDAEADQGAGRLDLVSTSDTAPSAPYRAQFSALCDGGQGRPVEKHFMSADGQYVLFDTPTALVPRDNNGPAGMDAYRWHDGEVALISKGTGPQWSSSQGIDASGANAFFVTEDALAYTDGDAVHDLYVARTGGGFPYVPRPGCEGDACQPPLTPPPAQTTPGTETFNGPGNETPTEDTAFYTVGGISRSAQRKLARTGRLTVSVRVGEAGTVQATATARVRRVLATVASGKRTARRAGTVKIPLRLSGAARRQLRSNGRLNVKLEVRFSKVPGATTKRLTLRAGRTRASRRRGARRSAKGSPSTASKGR